MFIRDIRTKRGKAHRVIPVEVRLPVRMGHRDAETLFAEPLAAELAAAGLGSVMSCALRKRASGEVIGVDLYLALTRPGQSALAAVAVMLEALAAPCGSSIRLADAPGSPLLFGRAEGLELSIDSQDIASAAARRDFAVTCRAAAEKVGVNRGWHEAEGRTRFFFYSDNLPVMKKHLARILKEHPEFSDAALRPLA